MHIFLRSIAASCFAVLNLFAAEPPPNADRWLTNASILPDQFLRAIVRTNVFATLHAEFIGGQLQVVCASSKGISEMRLVASTDAPGHWPARDWHTHPVFLRGPNRIGELPVESLDVPLIYFLAGRDGSNSIVSPMRIVEPRVLGMEQPTRWFWAFLEGFEQDLESWRVSDPAGVRTDSLAKDGRAALVARVPSRHRSVTVQTTRIRGWFLEEHGATGIGLWLRVKSKGGVAAFTLLANASSTNQVAARRAETASLSTNWSKVMLPFESFPKLPLGDVDLFSIELSAEPGTEFLLDNVYLLGRWRDDF